MWYYEHSFFGCFNFKWYFPCIKRNRAFWIIVCTATLGRLNGSVYIRMCTERIKLMCWFLRLFGNTVLGGEDILKWMKHVSLIIIFFFTVDLTTLGSMYRSWSSSLHNTPYTSPYVDANICLTILFSNTCCVWLSFTCLACTQQVTWIMLSLSGSEDQTVDFQN
jgi:hypothetical protein